MPGGVPLQSSSRLTAGRPFGGRRRLPEVPSPFDDITRSGPVCDGPSGSAAVPTPGFLTPSPVSWLRSSSRVCFAPQPSLGFVSLQSVPLASGRAPLVGVAGSLVVRPGRAPVRRSRSSHLRPSPTRATFGRRPWPDPAEARGSLSAPRGASRSPWTSLAGLTSARTSSSTSELSSLRESVHTARRSPVARRPVLSWAFRPSRALLPPDPGPSHPPRPEASLLPLAARASRRDARRPGLPCSGHFSSACAASAPLLGTLEVGWTSRGRPKRPARDPSAVTGLIQPGPCCPSAAASTPMTFDAQANLRPSSSRAT